MRQSSHKTGYKLIKTLFKALIVKLWCFSSALCLNLQKKCKQNSTLHLRLLIAAALVLVTASGWYVAAKGSDKKTSLGQDESILLYPTKVDSTGWAGVVNVLEQNQSEEAIYQNFSAIKSAYIPLTGEPFLNDVSYDALENNQSSISVNTNSDTDISSTTIQSPKASSASSTESETETTESPAETVDPLDTSTEVSVPDEVDDTNVSQDTPTSESQVTPEEVIENSTGDVQSVSLGNTLSPVYGLFAWARETFFLAANSTTTSLETESEVVSDTNDVIQVVDDDQSENNLNDNAVIQSESVQVNDFLLDANTDGVDVLDDSETTSSTAAVNEVEEEIVAPEVSTTIEDDQVVANTTSSGSVTDPAPAVSVQNDASTSTVATTTNSDLNTATSSEVYEKNSNNQTFVESYSTTTNYESNYVLTVSDFGVPELTRGQFITGAQLRLSLAAQLDEMATGTRNYFEIVYRAPEYTQTIGVIDIESEISNALNGGYYLFALPEGVIETNFENASIDIIFHGDVEDLDGAFLDSVWLELNSKVINRDDLLDRTRVKSLLHLKQPKFSEMVSDQVDFLRSESPVFNLRYKPQRNPVVRTFRGMFADRVIEVDSVDLNHAGAGSVGVKPKVVVTNEGLITISFDEKDRQKLLPGKYTIDFTVHEGSVSYQEEFDFQWGILAINPDKTESEVGEVVDISIGAITPNGNTVCNAILNLFVVDPAGFVNSVPVVTSGQCFGNNVTDVADYSASFTSQIDGVHELYLERVDESGNVVGHTTDTFEVVTDHNLSIKRNGPTRIYPPSPYPMVLTVVSHDSFEGELVEKIPVGFEVFDTDAQINIEGDYQELVWKVDLSASSSKTFSYRFDAPDISPFLYELGPASLSELVQSSLVIETVSSSSATSTLSADTSVSGEAVFVEHRQWQIASDAVGNMLLLWDGSGNLPADWKCLSCNGGAFTDAFPIGSSTASTTGGALTHSHNASGSVAAADDGVSEGGATDDISPNLHTHTYTPTISSESNVPLYRDLRIIKYEGTAGDPMTIPTGAIAIFDVASSSLPSGWVRYEAQDGYFVRGGNSPGSISGSNIHAHDITGNTSAGDGTPSRDRNNPTQVGVSNATHIHSVSTTTATSTIQPPYIEVVLAKMTATSATPSGLISMWTEDVATGWSDLSTDGASPFSNRFLKASTTYGDTGGVASHAHAAVTNILSSFPVGTETAKSNASGDGISDTHRHVVTVNNFTTVSNLPPFVTVVYGKNLGGSSLYDQLSYRWYVNEDNQTPTDPWPSGASDLTEREPIAATSTELVSGDQIRLRISAQVSNATSSAGEVFKLQYGEGNTCSAISTWVTVGDAASSTLWTGYANSGVTDHSSLSSTTLDSTTVGQTYEESGFASSTPNDIGPTKVGEWDFVLENNDATTGTNYCFRMVEEDGTAFTTYSSYPQLLTNSAPATATLSVLFDNEKSSTTEPIFYFFTTDAEEEQIYYQIHIDDDYAFSNPIVADRDSINVNEADQFENQILVNEKSLFTQGQLMKFTTETTLSNDTTYYWRVRAQDPAGSGDWGEWSDIWSFTVDDSITASTWYQNTEEQFDTNTLVDLETPAANYVDLAGAAATGTMISTPIDFDDGTMGTAWGQFYFDETDSGNVVNYQIEYLTSGGTWDLIPDSELSGNSSGLNATTSLISLDTDTYNQIRLVANFTGSTGSPRLNSWSVEWGYRIETPTITKLFPNEKVGTTTPTFEFTTTDPQSDPLEYEISWSSTTDFSASTTRNSSTSAGFVNIDNQGNSNPFTSGQTIQFTVQPADELVDGETYWWRVRAKDPSPPGSDAYSFWTSARSFTVSSGTVASTWFQTTKEQFDTDVLSGTISVSGNGVSVATSSSEAMMVYGQNADSVPHYRQWNGSSWSSEGNMQDVGAPIVWATVKAGTTREEYVAMTIDTDGDLNVQVFSEGSWGNLLEITTSVGSISAKGADIAYETYSGDAMVVYCENAADPNYYIWDGTNWNSGTSINLTTTNNCEWVRVAADPDSNELMMATRNAAGDAYEAQIWNATTSTWGNPATFGSTIDAGSEGMSIGYEESGDQALFITSNGSPKNFKYDVWDGSSWLGGNNTLTIGDQFMWGDLVSDVGTDEMALCLIDDTNDIAVAHWSGSAWSLDDNLEIDGKAKSEPPFACVYETIAANDGNVLLAYSDTTATNHIYSTTPATWSTEAQIQSIGPTATMVLERTGVGTILGMFNDDTSDDLLFSSWDGLNWATTTTIEADAPTLGTPYSIGARNEGTEGTTIASPGIDFDDGNGPYWQRMSWVDSTPGSSEILYSVQYYNTASSAWALIPDSDLPGNEAGTTTSPIDLSGLNKNTYDLIRPYATLSCDDFSNCPTIWDWTVEWAEGINVSGSYRQYDQQTDKNSGVVYVAVNGVWQNGKTGSVSNGLWSISNVNTAPGDIITVFVNGTSSEARAVGVTRYDGIGDVKGMELYERHLSLGSYDATSTPLTNTDVALYNSDNDPDAFVNISTSTTLSVCAVAGCGDVRLYINASTTFRPGGNVLTHDIQNDGTIVATTTLYISGSWDNNATTTLTSSSLVFTATSSVESIDDTDAVNPIFNNLTFGTTTGNATWTLLTTLDINGNLTVSRGTLSRGTTSINIAGDLTNGSNGIWVGVGTTTFDGSSDANWSDANVTLQNIGNVVIDGGTKNVELSGDVAANTLTIGSNDTLDAGVGNNGITVYSTWNNGAGGSFAAQAGTVTFAATTTSVQITTGGDAFYDLTFSGVGGGWSFVENTLSIDHDLTIATGTVDLPTATTTLGGSFSSAGGTFAHNNGVIYFTSSVAETIVASGTPFVNPFGDLHFDGSGSWVFGDANATTSGNVYVTQGSVTFPSGVLEIGGTLQDNGGSFSANSGTVRLTSIDAEILRAGGSQLYNLLVAGSGSWSFAGTNATILNDLTIESGTLTLPSGTLTLGGSFTNSAVFDANSGTVLFNSADTGEEIDLGAYSLYNATFSNSAGGWTILTHATATNNFALTSANDFTLNSGQTLSVGGEFTNNVGDVTVWSGSTLSLEAGTYDVNNKTDIGDQYENLRLGATAKINIWKSAATTTTVTSGGYLYSQNHASTTGDLYIFGDYTRATATEYWRYDTDFDGTDLSGGSERQVNVYFASGATASFSSSTLNVTGSSTASTTVQNQGSGTYTISVTGGTTTMRYYEFADLGLGGLSLLGSTTVTSLADGAYTVGANGGTALTVSSTTIETNPAFQIYRVRFSTTTAISASNVTQTDGTPSSYWWFRNSTGNIDGEAFDLDPNAILGNPGSIRWDDSALTLTISGTVYSDDGDTELTSGVCDGSTTTVRIVVDGGAIYDDFCSNVDGSYSISGVAIVGDPALTVFINSTSGAPKAVTVTKTLTANIDNLDLYANRVITRHEDTSAMTIADMAVYDGNDDPDIPFTAATGTPDTLVVNADTELHVWATSTFTPGGTVTLTSGGSGETYDGSLHIGPEATFTGESTTTYRIGGSLTLDTDATFVPASTTVIMTATTTGKTINATSSGTVTLNALSFTGVGGAWNINGNLSATADIYVATGTVTGTEDITLSRGSFYGNGLVSLGGGTTTINKTNTLGGEQGWTFYDLVLGSGSVVGTTTPGSTATTTVSNQMVISTAHFLDAGASSWNLSGSGNVLTEDGTLLEDTSRFTYSGVSTTSITSTDYYNLTLDAAESSPTYQAIGSGIQVFNDLVIAPTGTTTVDFNANDPALNVDGDMTINTLGTFIASNSGSFTVSGSYDNNGTFTASGGTVTFDGSGSPIITAGGSNFANVTINGTGDFLLLDSATATEAFTLSAVNTFSLGSFESLAVGGTFTNSVGGASTFWTNSTLYLYGGGNYAINSKTVGDTYHEIKVGPGTQIRMWDSDAASTTVDSTGSLYSMDNADVAGDLYIYGQYQKTSGTDHWSYLKDFDGSALAIANRRKVDVYIGSGNSVVYSSGGALSMLGSSTASTTVQNQGSGVYSFRIADNGSTTMNYYEFEDVDRNGLTFSGSPDVADLSYGSFLVANDNDAGMTVGGTVISNNPALTFTGNIFATTSGVANATNTAATGTAVSSWQFTNHSGDIDGEAFDIDPDGDPGYISWDDSSSSTVVTGRVYADEGSTVSSVCTGTTTNVRLVINGVTSTSTPCDGDGLGGGTGVYSFNGINYGANASLVVYIDNEDENGAAVTIDPVSNINNLDIYENRVIVRHEGVNPITIADMSPWDSVKDPADIMFTVSGSDLTVLSDTKLIVWTNKEFAPGGNVTISGGGSGSAFDGTLEAYSGSTWTSAGSETHSIGGSMIFDASATFEAANSTTTFTSAGNGRTINVNSDSFYNLEFTGAGSWSVTDPILDVNNLLITNGTTTLPTGTTTVSGGFNNNGGKFNHNSSLMIFDGSGANGVVFGGSSAAQINFTGSGSWNMSDTDATSTNAVTVSSGTLTLPSGTLALGGSFRNVGGTITHNSGEVIISTSTTASLLASSSDMYSVTFRNGGTFTLEDGSLSLLGNFEVASGSVSFYAYGTTSIGGSFLATGGTFDVATGTILFNSSDPGETINPGVSDFYNVTIAGASGGWTVTSNATATNNFSLTSAGDYTQQSGTTLYVGNVFTNSEGGSATTWAGSNLILDSGTMYSINDEGDSGDQYETLTIGANTDIEAWHSAATTTDVDSTASLYSQDNASMDGELYIYGDYHIGTSTDNWSYATDFDGSPLSGGSRRAVTVFMAANSTTTVDGGTLSMIGESGFETTVTNQGSGQYAFIVNAGTLSAQYYAFRNLDTDGLQLSGTPTISSLDYGDFELAVNGGSLITLSSTTLTANASLITTGARFATTTAITGTNVNLSGTASSAWTFTAHTGNLDGEAFDNDGGSVCGSIRWDDSSCLLTQQTHYRWRNDDGGLGVPDNEWYNASWGRRKSVRIDNNDASPYTDPVVELKVLYESGDMQPDFDDLRFTDVSGTNTIPFFVASSTNSTAAEVWVKIPSLPASDSTTIYMYYKNDSAVSVSSSTETFIAADDFENGNVTDNYSGETGIFAVDGSFAYGGSYGLDNTGNESTEANYGIARFDQTVSRGETIRYEQSVYAGIGSGDEVCTMFGVQSPVTASDNYAVCIEQFGEPRISIVEDAVSTDRTGTQLASSTVTFDYTGWYTVEIDWQTNDNIFVTLFDSSGTVIGTTSATTDGSITSGGYGFTYYFNNGGWDNFTSRPYLVTEPTIRFGAESVDGGATWAAALDTEATEFSPDDIARVRFSVENTGLTVTDDYLLEFAEQGAAPSCESVSGASFATVPVSGSCGLSPVCMATTTQAANNANTTDLLVGPEGDFVAGKFVENPSNQTSSIVIDQNEYTEVEFAVRPTSYVSDQNICFRMSDAGDDLDTYLKVAKMSVKFDPSFGAVTLNNGQDIVINPGSTTTVYATATVTDKNGYADLVSGSSTIYRSGAGAACAADNNDCYISAGAPQCNFTNCSGNSCVLECSADIYYHADPTDAGAYVGEEWLAYLEVVDQAGGTDLGSAPGVELTTMLALDVEDTINYGSLAASTTSTYNATTTILNYGNAAIDIQVEGNDLTDGEASTIAVEEQRFSTSTFAYKTCTDCTTLSSTSIDYEVDISKPTTSSPYTSDNLYWGIRIPYGVASNPHSGNNTFYVVAD